MGFREVRKAVIQKLKEGQIQHEARAGSIDEKNLLLVGKVTVEEVIGLLHATTGNQHETSKHHQDDSIDVHIFKPIRKGKRGISNAF